MASFLWTPAQRVRLFFTTTHSDLYRQLSLNILREVCSYLDTTFLLVVPSVRCNRVYVVDLATKTQTSISGGAWLQSGEMFCIVGACSLFLVGDTINCTTVKQYDLCSGKVSYEQSLCKSRFSPGIACFDSDVLLFGGWSQGTLKSCEAFSLVEKYWAPYPDMLTAKESFMPVKHRREIYLPALCQEGQRLEVFTPATRQYRLLPLRLQERYSGSVSFIYDEELFVFTTGKNILAWRLDSEESDPRTIGRLKDERSAHSNGPTVRYGNCEYWHSFGVAVFDFKKKRLLSEDYVLANG